VAIAIWSTSMSIHPWQLAAGVALGVVIGGAIACAAGQDASRAVSDTVETINRMIGREQQPAPLEEKQRRRQATEQSAAKMLRDQQAQQLRADRQKGVGRLRERGSGRGSAQGTRLDEVLQEVAQMRRQPEQRDDGRMRQ
jgi:hypothetical protein